MTKLLYTWVLIALCSTVVRAAVAPEVPESPAPTATASLFAIDEAALEDDFASLDELEQYLLTNGTISYSDLQQSQAPLLASMGLDNLEGDSPLAPAFSIDEMVWIAFVWGFLCCPIGFFVVAINKNKDSNSKISFWVGWAVGVVLGGISNAIFFAFN
ncbi:MAG: hypothetical protein OHK0039_04660 [Bacteroidia bacterium]